MEIVVNAKKRELKGTGASRRLRRAGGVPAIVYGAGQDAVQITLDHNEIYHSLRKESFHASVLTMNIDGEKSQVILRDTQWHPYKQQVVHVDFLRIKAGEKIHIKVPLRFLHGDVAPGVKLQDGIMTHVMNEIEVVCLPRQLPDSIEVDVKDLETGDLIHASQLQLPEGVELVLRGGEEDPVVVMCVAPRVSTAADEEAEAEAAEAEAEAEGEGEGEGEETKEDKGEED